MSFPMVEPMAELEIADDVALTCDGTRVHKNIAGCSSFCHCGLGKFSRKHLHLNSIVCNFSILF